MTAVIDAPTSTRRTKTREPRSTPTPPAPRVKLPVGRAISRRTIRAKIREETGTSRIAARVITAMALNHCRWHKKPEYGFVHLGRVAMKFHEVFEMVAPDGEANPARGSAHDLICRRGFGNDYEVLVHDKKNGKLCGTGTSYRSRMG